MISPDIKDLMRNMDSRYTLVVTAAKRARQLTAGAEPLTRFRSDKPVTLAIHEIAEGKVDYFRDAAGPPEYGDGTRGESGGGRAFEMNDDYDGNYSYRYGKDGEDEAIAGDEDYEAEEEEEAETLDERDYKNGEPNGDDSDKG